MYLKVVNTVTAIACYFSENLSMPSMYNTVHRKRCTMINECIMCAILYD